MFRLNEYGGVCEKCLTWVAPFQGRSFLDKLTICGICFIEFENELIEFFRKIFNFKTKDETKQIFIELTNDQLG